MKGRDFTLEKYRALCQALINEKFKAVPIKDYLLDSQRFKSKIVILRHDVDRNPTNAKNIAEIEHHFGIHSTYYFRTIKKVFKSEIIKRIASLGHEIGYHYETLSRERGDYEKAIQSFESDLVLFRKMVDVKTICMHGNPLSRWDNRKLWNKYDLKAFDLMGEAYLSIDYSDVVYFTDTGRSWNAGKLNLRDHVSCENPYKVRSTDDLIMLIKKQNIRKLCIQTHPERWNQQYSKWVLSLLQDLFFNVMKLILSLRNVPKRILSINK